MGIFDRAASLEGVTAGGGEATVVVEEPGVFELHVLALLSGKGAVLGPAAGDT
jgi:hypothetical protein